ncbi:MAG: hypothetical protein IIZ78_05580 [Clostridiales bacterium]|nr:hypothetical protein [Clostridiales bacterium]
MLYKEYIANKFKGKRVRFTCDCVLRIDIIGEIVGYEIHNNEIIYKVLTGNRIVPVGENTRGLTIEIL